MRQEGVGVAALRHRPAALEAGRQGVALDHGHPLVGLRERPGGQQPGHAPTDHDGVLTDASHVCFLLVAVVAQAAAGRLLRGRPGDAGHLRPPLEL